MGNITAEKTAAQPLGEKRHKPGLGHKEVPAKGPFSGKILGSKLRTLL